MDFYAFLEESESENEEKKYKPPKKRWFGLCKLFNKSYVSVETV